MFKNNGGRAAVALGISLGFAAALAGPARADLPGYAVFGGAGVSFGASATIIGGDLATNGSLVTGAFSTFTGAVSGGGSLSYLSTGGSSTFGGPVTFNGDTSFGSFNTFNGPVNSGGNATFASSATINANVTAAGSITTSFATVNGNLTAGQDVSLTTSFDKMTGNIRASHNVTVNGPLTGKVVYGNTLTVGPFGSISGPTAVGGGPVVPATYAPLTAPSHPFTAGGPAVTAGGSLAAPLAPGSYGALNIPWPNDLYLTAGDYYFTTFTLPGGENIHLENLTPSSHINIFVTGDVTLGSIIFMKVNEQDFASAPASLSANVLLETHGNYTQNSLGDNQFFGTILAPQGNVTIGQYSSVTGSVLTNGTANISVGFTDTYVPSTIAAPEPASVAILTLAPLGLLPRRRRAAKL
ncbi:MAG: hypothetical protein JWL69_2711 [Phycisphaerales bacterium]|nr:hypothetical protein [Phycisphaerales bacterium]